MVTRNAVFPLGDLSSRVHAVAEIAANNAADVDEAARFPAEVCAALKQQSLLGIRVPRDSVGKVPGSSM